MTQLTFHIDVVSNTEEIFTGTVVSAVVPVTGGDVGIYARHAPLLAICRPGQLKLTYADGEENFLYISGGLLEVHTKGVTVLADNVVRAQNIDEAAAIKAKNEAMAMIQRRGDDCDCAQSYADLLRAIEMLKTLDNCRRSTRNR